MCFRPACNSCKGELSSVTSSCFSWSRSIPVLPPDSAAVAEAAPPADFTGNFSLKAIGVRKCCITASISVLATELSNTETTQDR